MKLAKGRVKFEAWCKDEEGTSIEVKEIAN
jgi:hypothetical protein